MKVVIVEDEAPAFRRLQKLIEETDSTIEIIEVLDSVKDTVLWLNKNEDPDLIFMDIQLSDGLSFDIFDQVEVNAPVIFTTAFDEYSLKAFKVNSIDYLLKPINQVELKESLEKLRKLKASFGNGNGSSPDLRNVIEEIRNQSRSYKDRFLVKVGDKLMAIYTHEIAFIYTHNSVVHLVEKSGKKYILDHSLDEAQELLNPESFYRANRQYILHLPFIRVVHKYHKGKLLVELSIDNEEHIVVSAEKATDFKNWFGGS